MAGPDARVPAGLAGSNVPVVLTQGQRQHLRALGYVQQSHPMETLRAETPGSSSRLRYPSGQHRTRLAAVERAEGLYTSGKVLN